MASIFGRAIVVTKTNKSGGSLAKGDVVIVDSANDNAITTTTSAGTTVTVGVVVEENGIANNATGRVQFGGHVGLVNVNASVTRGHYGSTHTVAKQATDAGASRVVGTFCVFTTGGTTPEADLFIQPDASAATGNVATDSIWDAKGDLAAGTGANTAAALTVGANGTILMADSAQSTGLVWGPPAWTSWNPALTAASSNPTLGSGSSVAGSYLQMGKFVVASGIIRFGSSGVNAGSGEYYVSLPVNMQNVDQVAGSGAFYDSSTGKAYLLVPLRASASTVAMFVDNATSYSLSSSNPITPAASDSIRIMLMYEAE